MKRIKKYRSLSLNLEIWMDELLTLKAKNMGVSRSHLVRTLIQQSLTRSVQATPDKIGYYNDSEGVLRAIK